MFFPSKTFGGAASSSRGVAIRGQSRKEETREEVLERTRQERERRKRQRLETKAANTIQAVYRSWIVRRHNVQQQRQLWSGAYGSSGPTLANLQEDRLVVSRLLFFLDVEREADVRLLASFVRVIVKNVKVPELGCLWADYNNEQMKMRIVARLRTLALSCLRALQSHRYSYQSVLAGTRPAVPADSPSPAPALLESLMLLVAPETYAASLGQAAASHLSASILLHLANNSMFCVLRQMLGTISDSASLAAKPYLEVLTTQLTVRTIALKGWSPSKPTDAIHALLFVPNIWRMCSSLQPVAARVVRGALSHMAPWASAGRLVDLLPGDVPGGKAGAVAMLLSNLLQVSGKVIQPQQQPAPAAASTSAAAAAAAGGGDKAAALPPAPTAVAVAHAREAALKLVKVMSGAMELLPLSPFFPAAGSSGGAAEDRQAGQYGGREGMRLAVPADEMLPSELVLSVQALTELPGRQLLKQLVAVLLPHTREQPLPWSPGQPLGALQAAGEAAYSLCHLIATLSELPMQHQRVMLPLSVSADLVERLWWSFLRPARAADLASIEWLPASASGRRVSTSGASGILSGENSTAGGSGHGGEALGSLGGFLSLRTNASMGRRGSAAGGISPDGGSPRAGSMDLDRSSFGVGMLGTSPLERTTYMHHAASMGAVGGSSSSQPPSLPLSTAPSAPVPMQVKAQLAALQSQLQSQPWQPISDDDPGWMLPLVVMAEAFSAHIMTSDLDEFYVKQRPLALDQLYSPAEPEAGLLAMLRDALWQVLWTDGDRVHSNTGEALFNALAESGGELFEQLSERNARRSFCPSESFHATNLAPERFLSEANTSRSAADDSGRVWQVLRHAPVLVPFTERAKLFQGMVAQERQRYREMEEAHAFEMSLLQGGLNNRFVQIRRNTLLYDGFDKLNTLGEGLKGRVRVSFIDQHGAAEAGVDGGGLFKDFMEELMKQGFSEQYGLFATNSDHQLYPNPSAISVVEEGPRLLEFLGRMLGKALYEGILLELPLAGFFLKKFRGAHCDLNDLPTLDPEVYRNLLLLRHYKGDVADLALTFSITETVFGTHREVELKPGGRTIPVTADNVMEYIHRVAHYRLNIAPRPAVQAFLRGFYDLIPAEWVSMFSGEELQMLLSGSEEGIDLEDLQAHVEYAGGYHEDHPVIALLWEAVGSFSVEEQHNFLRFVTACSRAPLLGFRYLEPRLCVQMSGSMLDPAAPSRLPTASTCMNLLKLPPYRTLEQMKEKLLYAINSGAGFDLS